MKKPLDKGGLGIRRVSTANQALLGKMSWDLAVDNDSLWSRIIKGKYCISMEGLTPIANFCCVEGGCQHCLEVQC